MSTSVSQTHTKAHDVSSIPSLGSGLGYRRPLSKLVRESHEEVDFLEVVTEQYLGGREQLDELRELCEMFTVVPHGIALSIGSKRLDNEYLRAIRDVSDATGSPYYSEHLAITRAPGIDIGHLSPLWFDGSLLDDVVDNVARVQDFLGKPLVLENVTYLFEIPDARMRQSDFFTLLMERTGCGCLLDLTNLYTNSVNHHFDPVVFLDEMPLDRVVQVHLAGGYVSDGVLIDGHCAPVENGTWSLLEVLAVRTRIRACILEHDSNFPEAGAVLLDQVARARRLIAGTGY